VFLMALVAIVASMLLVLVRAALGPTVFDRLVAVNNFGTNTVLLIAVSGFYTGRPEWLDLALVYTLVNFTGTIAVTRWSRFGHLATSRSAEDAVADFRGRQQ
jgi:multicomponent Na+:H+ antiporter subunit F